MKTKECAETKKTVTSSIQKEHAKYTALQDPAIEDGNAPSDIPKVFVTNGKAQDNVSEEINANSDIRFQLAPLSVNFVIV